MIISLTVLYLSHSSESNGIDSSFLRGRVKLIYQVSLYKTKRKSFLRGEAQRTKPPMNGNELQDLALLQPTILGIHHFPRNSIFSAAVRTDFLINICRTNSTVLPPFFASMGSWMATSRMILIYAGLHIPSLKNGAPRWKQTACTYTDPRTTDFYLGFVLQMGTSMHIPFSRKKEKIFK